MKVEKWMTSDVVTVDSSLPLIEAYRIFHDYEIRHLPVVEEGRLIGIISKRDIGRRVLKNMPMGDLNDMGIVLDAMIKRVKSINKGDSIERAALMMHNEKIGALPVVVRGNQLVGIITIHDMLEVLVAELTAKNKQS